MSLSSETIVLTSPTPPRSSAMRLGDLPLIPIVILAVIALTAIFADMLAPHNPEVGSLTALPPARPSGRQAAAPTTYSVPTNWDATCCRG